jgi:glutathione S-transferase
LSELILHQYAGSPFSEKVRLILGAKGLSWAAVTIPTIMPKPDLVALTGGYRRTPVLQVGADVYCDSTLIARVLEARQPAPSLYPPEQALAPILAQWADTTLFWTVVPYVMQPAGAAVLFAGAPPEALQAFAADRKGFTAGLRRPSPADASVALGSYLAALDAQLADHRRHLLGEALTIADFSVAHCLWFLRMAGPLAAILDPYEHLRAWLDHVLAYGHGRWHRLDAGEAVAIAATAAEGSLVPLSVTPGLGWHAGQHVSVSAIDYGTDPVAGTLVGLSAEEVVLRRTDERAGTVHVHFPRIGFQIRQETT